jgi:hypothetical protein
MDLAGHKETYGTHCLDRVLSNGVEKLNLESKIANLVSDATLVLLARKGNF